jgi:hypothetical protein
MPEKRKEVKMSKSVGVNVSANDLWQVVGPGFAEAGKWSTAVDHSAGHGEGQFDGATCDTRSCDLSAKGFSSVNERITEYDANNRTLAFDVFEGMPGFVTYTNNRTVVTEISQDQSQAELQITMHMKPFLGWLLGGMLKKNLSNLIVSALDDLKVFAETGKPSGRKQARIKKLSAKAA